jgi:hypothetical protein
VYIGDSSPECRAKLNVTKFKYMEMTVRNKISFMKKLRANHTRAMFATTWIRNLSARLLSEKITIRKSIILLIVLYGCETWSLT